MGTTSNRSSLTEQLLADRFQQVITSTAHDVPRVPHFQAVYTEVTCRQGIADFVGVVRGASDKIEAVQEPLRRSCSLGAASRVLGALVSARKPVPAGDLATRTELSPRIVRRTLGYLVSNSCVSVVAPDSYVFPNDSALPWPDMWAFELKLSDWRRAIFQALQYAAFASHVLVVMPESKSKVATTNRDAFARLGIGLLLLDPQTGHVRQIAPARHIGPASPSQALYAAGKIESLATAAPALKHR